MRPSTKRRFMSESAQWIVGAEHPTPHLSIHLASVSDVHDDDHNFCVTNFTDESPIANPVFPKLPQISLKFGAKRSRIFGSAKPVSQKISNSLLNWGIDLPKFLSRNFGELNRPTQARPPTFLAARAFDFSS